MRTVACSLCFATVVREVERACVHKLSVCGCGRVGEIHRAQKRRGDGHTHTPTIHARDAADTRAGRLAAVAAAHRLPAAARAAERALPQPVPKTLTLKEADLRLCALGVHEAAPIQAGSRPVAGTDKTPPRPVPPSSRGPTVPTVASAKASSGSNEAPPPPAAALMQAAEDATTQQQQHQLRRHQLPPPRERVASSTATC